MSNNCSIRLKRNCYRTSMWSICSLRALWTQQPRWGQWFKQCSCGHKTIYNTPKRQCQSYRKRFTKTLKTYNNLLRTFKFKNQAYSTISTFVENHLTTPHSFPVKKNLKQNIISNTNNHSRYPKKLLLSLPSISNKINQLDKPILNTINTHYFKINFNFLIPN